MFYDSYRIFKYTTQQNLYVENKTTESISAQRLTVSNGETGKKLVSTYIIFKIGHWPWTV